MAFSPPNNEEPVKTVAELVEYARQELAADAERQAPVTAASNGDLASQTGATLDISHLKLTNLPIEVIFVIRNKVERLALSHNSNISIPPQIAQMERLRYLNIRWNGLRRFPNAVLQLTQLEILDLSKNKITSIPSEVKNMSSLKFLAIAKNRITRLPLALGEMTSLSKLKFDENPIAFPPPEIYQQLNDRNFSMEVEKEREVCQQVKRFLRQAALREQMRTSPDEDQSDTQHETPRPSRRIAPSGNQRFPVRPSISGFDTMGDPKSGSPDPHVPPPIVPMKSQARNFSGQKSQRILPLPLTARRGSEMTRSLSTTSVSSRTSKRHGVVPEKGSRALGSVSSMTSLHSLDTSTDRSSQVTVKASRSAHPASGNGFLFPNPNYDSSSDAVSPIEPRSGFLEPARGLSMIRSVSYGKTGSDANFPAAKRSAMTFDKLLKEALCTVHSSGSKDSSKNPRMFDAMTSNAELERRILRISEGSENSPGKATKAMRSLPTFASSTARAIVAILRSEKHFTRRAAESEDPMLCRMALIEMYASLVEVRNICISMGFKLHTSSSANFKSRPPMTPRQTRGASSRTVTPTQPKADLPLNPRLKRAPTIIQKHNKSTRSGLPPPPVSINSSRSNTMTSMTSAPPRSGDPTSLTYIPATAPQLHANTIRNQNELSDSEHFAHVWLKLDMGTRMANNCLRNCHSELTVRLDNARNTGQNTVANTYTLTLGNCNLSVTATTALAKRLQEVKDRVPGSRTQREFWMLCDNFVHSWADLVSSVKNMGDARYDGIPHDTKALKSYMRDCQRSVKEVSRTVSGSALYHAALRARQTNEQLPPLPMLPEGFTGNPPSDRTIYPPPTAINTAYANAMVPPIPAIPAQHNGFNTMPATPLTAALGPAAQAMVAHTPDGTFATNELTQTPRANTQYGSHARVDTVMQPQGGYGRR